MQKGLQFVCLFLFFLFALLVNYFASLLLKAQSDRHWITFNAKISKISELGQTNKETITQQDTSQQTYDVTFVSQASFNRWRFMLEIAKRWKGPMSICYYLKEEEVPLFQKQLKTSSLRKNIHLDYRIQPNSSYYPVNALRNIAISHVTTSHFYLSDMDVWPSSTTYDALLQLSPQELSNEKLAIIVPAFQIRFKTCETFDECADFYNRYYPRVKPLLRTCLHDHLCSTFRPNEYLHDYYTTEWFYASRSLIPVSCFKSDTQEPYVVVKKTPSLPRFNESFINYSYNKVQWIEHLRWVGYSFAVLVNGYSVDIPHPESPYRKQFFTQLKETRIFPMIDVYYSFLNELNKTVPKMEVVPLCKKAHINQRRVYYSSSVKKKTSS